VTIEFGTGRMLKLSLLLYIFPLAALLAGAIIGDLAGSALNLNKSVFSAVTGFAAFFVSLTVLLALEKKAKSLDSYKPSVVAIKQKGSMPEEKCEHRP
jgi:sigma-E factor negative regulatory protein RseC